MHSIDTDDATVSPRPEGRGLRAAHPVSQTDVEVFRSRGRRACQERALVLTAVGIASEVISADGRFVLQVAAGDVEQASVHLRQYDLENSPRIDPPASRPQRLFAHAWVGCVAYAAWLLGVAYATANGLVSLEAFSRGELYGARVQQGQWWRAWTCLTLHLSGPHLAGNLLAGIWFGYFAGRQLGAGTAWLLIVVGAGTANLLQGLLGPPGYRSAGASTAVFAALGMMAAHTWWKGHHEPHSGLRRWIPLGAGVVLLGWLGTAGRHTDLMAHLLGFGVGVLIGWASACAIIDSRLARAPQWLAGLAAMAIMALAWGFALR